MRADRNCLRLRDIVFGGAVQDSCVLSVIKVFIDRRSPDLSEALAHLVGPSGRRICETVSASLRWFVVLSSPFPAGWPGGA